MTQTPATKPVFDPAALAAKAVEAEPIKTVRQSSSAMQNNPYVQHMVRSLETKKALEMPVDADQVHTFVSWLRDAAKKNDNGLRIEYRVGNGDRFTDPAKLPKTGTVKVRYQAAAKKNTGLAKRGTCPVCSRDVSVTQEGKVRSHKVDGAVCGGSGTDPKNVPAPAAPVAPASDTPAFQEPPAA